MTLPCSFSATFAPSTPTSVNNCFRMYTGGSSQAAISCWTAATRLHRQCHGLKNSWYLSDGGFWRLGPHLVLEQGFDYPEERVYLDQYIVVDARGIVTVYRNWFQDYTTQTIAMELKSSGFHVQGLWGDLCGTPLSDHTEWIGVVAQKNIPD